MLVGRSTVGPLCHQPCLWKLGLLNFCSLVTDLVFTYSVLGSQLLGIYLDLQNENHYDSMYYMYFQCSMFIPEARWLAQGYVNAI